jgi:hypothetical protein
LRQYFVVHLIIVVNEAPLSNILNNPEATGRVSLWGIELSLLDITYEKRKAIKSQVLPDFIAEWLELQNIGPPDCRVYGQCTSTGQKGSKAQEQV